MVSEEVFKGVSDAIKAIKKLEAGENIQPHSPEHAALTWAVLRLVDDNLLDARPLSGSNLKWAREVAHKHAQKRATACQKCGHDMSRSKAKLVSSDPVFKWSVRCGKCRTIHHATTKFPVATGQEVNNDGSQK